MNFFAKEGVGAVVTYRLECPIDAKTPPPCWARELFGAATQIRTGDLILTKDVLYQLSHSSVCNVPIISEAHLFVKRNFKRSFRNFRKISMSPDFQKTRVSDKNEQVCKPGSVVNCHLSRRRVAAALMPPARTVAGQAGAHTVLLRIGFTAPPCYHGAG